MAKKRLRKYKIEKKEILNFKVSRADREEMQANADKYCEGNLSEWIRYAACRLKPRQSDLVEV